MMPLARKARRMAAFGHSTATRSGTRACLKARFFTCLLLIFYQLRAWFNFMPHFSITFTSSPITSNVSEIIRISFSAISFWLLSFSPNKEEEITSPHARAHDSLFIYAADAPNDRMTALVSMALHTPFAAFDIYQNTYHTSLRQHGKAKLDDDIISFLLRYYIVEVYIALMGQKTSSSQKPTTWRPSSFSTPTFISPSLYRFTPHFFFDAAFQFFLDTIRFDDARLPTIRP